MRFRRLDLNLLAALDKLLTLRSVTRAADELAITQSAMSNALNRLRQYFDDPLLVQVGRQMELTPRAIMLADPVRDVLVRIESAIATAPDFDPATVQRRAALMVSDYTLHTLIPPFIRRLARLAPGFGIDLKPQQTYPGLQLERGDTDLLIAPSPFLSPDHPSEVLFTDPFVCVTDAEHPAVRRGALLVDEFREAEFVTMRPMQNQASFAGHVLAGSGVELRESVTCFSFAALPALVQGSHRITLVQSRLARQCVAGGGLAILEPPLPIPPLEQSVQWHRMRSHDPALDWLRTQLSAAVIEMDAQGIHGIHGSH